MDVDNSASVEDSEHSNNAKEVNSQSDHVNVNGLNGYSSEKHKSHKSDHKDKHRDKDRDRDRERSKDHKSSSKDKDRHSSSKDKDRHSSHKSSSKDKDRGDRDKDRSDRDKDRSARDKDRSDRDKDRSDRDKERSDRDKHKDKNRDDKKSSSKDKDRDHKSSRDKDHKSSSSSKDKEGRDKDRDRERERDKEKHDKHRHSSSKDKDRHSSSKDKHRDRDRDREKHSSSKDKDRREKDKEKKAEKSKEELKVKEEIDAENKYDSAQDSVDEDDQKLVIKEDPDSQDEAENQNISQVSQASSCDYSLSQFKDEPRYSNENIKDEMDIKEDVDSQMDDDDSQQDEYGQMDEDVKEDDGDEDYKPKVEPMDDDSDEDKPLAARVKSTSSLKRKIRSDDEDEDDKPLISRKKVKKEKKEKKKKKHLDSDYEDEADDYKPIKKKEKKEKKEMKTKTKKAEQITEESPKKGGKKKKEEEQEVWKWWEEQKKDDGTKWKYLEHKGPVFAPPYEPLPSNVKFYYDGQEMALSEPAEEIAGFYAKMLEHDYTSKDIFNKNFFEDWRKSMTEKERKTITDLKKCNFRKMHTYFMDLSEKNKNRTKEEKLALKEKNEALLKEYGFCIIDGHKEKIGNFKIEPPGLFRGRGEHPKMGKLKRRVEAEDVIINCSKDSKIPEPPPGHKWKEVRHDSSVTWLASWTENVQSQVKYVMLNPSSKLKGEKDWQKYETARRLHNCIEKIRREYKNDWKSKEMRIRQRAVALYFIDRLALRAGNEKDEDQADTVGCCSLRVEHIELHERKDDKEYVVVFDFLGKDSIRYYNEIPVEKRVFKNLQLFMENKRPGDDLFDRLNTQIMNKHLNELMEGLTAKVFRTYNASWTLQQQLNELTNPDDSVAEKILSYNRANRAVAILCNHQRSVPKGHEKSMEKLKEKIDQKRDQIKDAERQVKDAEKDAKRGSVKEKVVYDKKKKMLQRLKEQLTKLEIQETDRDENKTIALGTSKLNYLDPRISVAWCKKYDVPIEKIYNKTQRDKFRWAIDMAGPDYEF